MWLKDLYVKINHSFIYDYETERATFEEQQEFLAGLKKPKNDYEMAYNHYLAQMFYYYDRKVQILFNLGSALLLPLTFLKMKRAGRAYGSLKGETLRGAVISKSFKVSPDDIWPRELETEYGEVRMRKPEQKTALDADAVRFFRGVWRRYPFHPYFLMIVLRRLGELCPALHEEKPKAYVVYTRERDFSVPLLTGFCEKNGIDFVSFMHGDYFYTADKACMRFSKYYVWDEHYVDMFTRLMWPKKQLIVYHPGKLDGITKPRPDGKYDYFLTYYFGAESRARIQGVKRAFDVFRAKGLRCKVRPHPRFSDVEYIREVFAGDYVEDTKTETLEWSLECSRYTCALNSTVLAQAYYSGKEFVIDDYADPGRYEALLKKDYIMMAKPHRLLSELVKEYS
jgi:hypothetical protein